MTRTMRFQPRWAGLVVCFLAFLSTCHPKSDIDMNTSQNETDLTVVLSCNSLDLQIDSICLLDPPSKDCFQEKEMTTPCDSRRNYPHTFKNLTFGSDYFVQLHYHSISDKTGILPAPEIKFITMKPSKPSDVSANWINETCEIEWKQTGEMRTATAELRLQEPEIKILSSNCVHSRSGMQDYTDVQCSIPIDEYPLVNFSTVFISVSANSSQRTPPRQHSNTSINGCINVPDFETKMNVTKIGAGYVNIEILHLPNKYLNKVNVSGYQLNLSDSGKCFIYFETQLCFQDNLTLDCEHGSRLVSNLSGSIGTELTVPDLQYEQSYTFQITPFYCHPLGKSVWKGKTEVIQTSVIQSPVIDVAPSLKGSELKVEWNCTDAPRDATFHVLVEDLVRGNKLDDLDPECSLPSNLTCQYSKPTHGKSQKGGSCRVRLGTAFWEYQVTVSVSSKQGNFSSSVIPIHTNPTAPGAVDSLMKTESSSRHCGNAKLTSRLEVCVRWRDMCPRQRNGRILKYQYQLLYRSNNSVAFSETTMFQVKSSNIEHYRHEWTRYNYSVIVPVKLGVRYLFKVKALTEDNVKGVESSITVLVEAKNVPRPIAPDTKKMETIVPKNQINTTDKTITIFLQDTTPFIRDKAGYPVTSVVLITRKGVKPKGNINLDDMPGYRNRSTALDTTGYIVKLDFGNGSSKAIEIGADGNCSQKQDEKYCNGPLDPGESYTIYTKICNEGGCVNVVLVKGIDTEDVKKKKEPPPAWMSAVISAGILVCLLIVVVIMCICCMISKRRSSPVLSEWTELPEINKKTRISRPLKLVVLESVIAKKQKDDARLLREEFEDLHVATQRKAAQVTGTSDVNSDRNRYADIVAYDHSRVKLALNETGSDYINANYIPGYNCDREYVATQGPLPSTIPHFWAMVWQQRSPIIVMLTLQKEEGKIKCEQYWGSEEGDEVQHGDIRVRTASVRHQDDYNITTLAIKDTQAEEDEPELELLHFHYLQWLDKTADVVPDSLLEFISTIRQSLTPGDPPMVVHCSAGVGRTGTFIALDYVMQLIEEKPMTAELDIYAFVIKMRKARYLMVQTEAQYILIHTCARQLMCQRRLKEYGDGEIRDSTASNMSREVVFSASCAGPGPGSDFGDSARGDSEESLNEADNSADRTVELDTAALSNLGEEETWVQKSSVSSGGEGDGAGQCGLVGSSSTEQLFNNTC